MWRPFARIIRTATGRRPRRDLWEIAHSLREHELRRDADELGFSADDLLSPGHQPPRFLGYYSLAGLEKAFRRYGMERALRKRGYRDFRIFLSREDRYTSTMRCTGRGPCGHDQHLLTECTARIIQLPRPRWIPPEAASALEGQERAVRLEWMLLQSPCDDFTPERPQLPGQRYPGLGLGRDVTDILLILGWRQRASAFLTNPFYVHNAILYSRKFVFQEPEDQGRFLALLAASQGRPLQQVGLAVENGFLIDENTGDAVPWFSDAPQIAALSRPLIRLYRSRLYSDAVFQTLGQLRYRIDWPAYDRVHDELVARLADNED